MIVIYWEMFFQALKKALGGKLSMGAAGGLHGVPYLDGL